MKDKILSHFAGNFSQFYGKYLPNIKHVGGDEWQALCPFHEESKPSFNFNSQKGTYFCHGCNKKGDALHFYGKLHDLDTKADFGKILKGIASDFGISMEEKQSHIVKTYDYTDETGNLLFQVCRMDPKDFRQRHRNGNGWVWNLKDVRRVLYRLPQVLQADEILVVEGEKDCDNLAGLDLVATCNPMGAGKWAPEYNECLKGKDVVLVPDNDNPGREHMVKVAQSLNGIAKTIKWLDLPGLPSKGDLSNFLSKFDDKVDAQERLSILIENADLYEPPKQVSQEDLILTSNQFIELDMPDKRKFLNPWLSENSISLISGWRGCGKTWFALSVLNAVSTGQSFGPWTCDEPVRCLFCDGEMPIQDVRERIKYLGINSDNLIIYCDALMHQHGLPRAHLANEAWRTKMKSILITRHVKLWVVDNLASLASGLDENSKKEWDPVNQWLLDLRFAGISTIMLHHMNKDGGQRGTSGREDNLDVSIALKKPSDYVPEDGARFITHFTKGRISTGDLNLISDTEFKLIQDDKSGAYTWTFGNVRKETSRAVLEMISEGVTDTKAICEALGITKGRVSQVKKQAINDGYLSTRGELSQSGTVFVHGL
jgi:hypothetical protein